MAHSGCLPGCPIEQHGAPPVTLPSHPTRGFWVPTVAGLLWEAPLLRRTLVRVVGTSDEGFRGTGADIECLFLNSSQPRQQTLESEQDILALKH